MSPIPLLDKSFAVPLAGAGLMACFVIHPYVGFALWALALAVLLQELLLLVALPFIALWRWASRPRRGY
jgi:hypothetical protein